MKQKKLTRYENEKARPVIPYFASTNWTFLLWICPYPNHFCDGQPVPDEKGRTESPKEPCEYYEFRGTLKSGCSHPKRWC